MKKDRADEIVERGRAKIQQTQSRFKSAQRGTRGRREHKAGAASSNKPRGGRLAR